MIPANQSTVLSSSSLPRICEQAQQQEEESDYQFRSQSIPICKNLNRTASELQLCVDEQLAEQRDYAFFSRLVNGIGKCQNTGTSPYLQMENQVCLAHIIQTRHEKITPEPCSDQWQPEQQQHDEQWSIGLTDEPGYVINDNDNSNNNYYHNLSMVPSHPIAIGSSAMEDDGAIFDLDL